MANKRQLKKAIGYACGEMAGECFFAQNTFENTNPEDWDKIVLDIALLQAEAVNRVSVDFDKVPKDFASGKEYKKARRTYFKAVEKALANYMKEESEKIVSQMNALAKAK
ncbi:MAG: hypothetical protein II691_04620 [Muribaculaceae bacterium]|nr:hypothetical protein [Muribaculaceae bacterium]MBQ3910573.1 hypothetical protein [Muribaculaceae bacterium]